jgi:hypothetical protein
VSEQKRPLHLILFDGRERQNKNNKPPNILKQNKNSTKTFVIVQCNELKRMCACLSHLLEQCRYSKLRIGMGEFWVKHGPDVQLKNSFYFCELQFSQVQTFRVTLRKYYMVPFQEYFRSSL